MNDDFGTYRNKFMSLRESLSQKPAFHFKKLRNSEFIKNSLMLLGGTLIAQIISMGSAPVITRLFTPKNLGLLALFLAIVNIVSGVGSLCYERALLLPKRNEDAINLYLLSLAILIGVSIGFFAIFLLFKKHLVTLFGLDDYVFWLWLIPVGIFLTGLTKNMTFWRVRNKQFKSISVARVFQAVVTSSIKIGFGFLVGAYTGGLITGYIAGTVVLLVIVYYRPSRMSLKEFRPHISREKIRELGVKYKSFPLFASWNVLLHLLSSNIIIFMFSFFFDAAVVGYYSLCASFLGRPVTIVVETVQKSYFQKAAESLAKGINLRINFKKITSGLILTGFFPFLILTVFGKVIFTFAFGQEWEAAGRYVQILAPFFFISYISSPANVIYEVCQKQNLRLGFNISLIVFRFAAVYAGYSISENPQFTILLFTIVNVVLNIGMILVAYVITKSQNVGQLQVDSGYFD